MKIQAIISSLAFATATLGLSSIAMAEDETDATGQQDNAELFSQLDVNADGVITMDEAAAIPDLEEQFEQLDQDASGDLDEQEFQEYMPQGSAN